MLYVFFGKDPVSLRARAHEHAAMLASSSESTLERVSPDNYAPGIVFDRAGATDLFGGTSIILFDTLLEDDAASEELLEATGALASSPNHFIVLEEKVSAPVLKVYKKEATLVEEVAGTSAPDERFNTFALADALARKDKKSLWVLLMRARRAGIAPEEIIGTLFWQIKTLRLAKKIKNAAEGGMKDFVYQKAKRAAAGFNDEELHTLSTSLIAVYHEGHAGKDIDIGLEKFVLTV